MHRTHSLTLPVAYSLISSAALQSQLLPFYNLPKESTLVFLYQGMHDTYLVQAPSAKYILRIYRSGWKTLPQVEAEIELLLMLKDQGSSVSYPMALANGSFIQPINSPEGERHAVLFSYAPGEKPSALNATHACLFGKLIANIHLSTQGKRIENLHRDYLVNPILDEVTQTIRVVLGAYPEAQNKLDSIVSAIHKKLTPSLLQELKTGICHGDPHYENICIEPITHKVTIYDFDFSGNGYLLYDIGSFCHYERNNKKVIESFLEGYEQILPLTKTEREVVPYFRVLMRLFHLGARSKNADGIRNPLWFTSEIKDKIDDIGKEVYSL